jgi:uncharacterized protein
MILKLLLIIGILVVIYYMFIKKKPLKEGDKSDTKEMVQCSACGVYTEISDSIISNNKYYCSKECVDKA